MNVAAIVMLILVGLFILTLFAVMLLGAYEITRKLIKKWRS